MHGNQCRPGSEIARGAVEGVPKRSAQARQHRFRQDLDTAVQRGKNGRHDQQQVNPPFSVRHGTDDWASVGVLDGMKEYSWGRELTIRTIKSIISEGRSNENRKRNRQLAAAAAETRCEPPPECSHSSPALSPPVSQAARTQPFPQALPNDEAEQRLAKQEKSQRRGSTVPASDGDCGVIIRLILLGDIADNKQGPDKDRPLQPLPRAARTRSLPQALPNDEAEQRLAKREKGQQRGSTVPAAGSDCGVIRRLILLGIWLTISRSPSKTVRYSLFRGLRAPDRCLRLFQTTRSNNDW